MDSLPSLAHRGRVVALAFFLNHEILLGLPAFGSGIGFSLFLVPFVSPNASKRLGPLLTLFLDG